MKGKIKANRSQLNSCYWSTQYIIYGAKASPAVLNSDPDNSIGQ